MGKGKGKAGGTGPRGGTRKIAQVRTHSLKSKPPKPSSSAAAAAAAAAGKTGIREETGGAAGGGGSTKKSKKARPSDAGHPPGSGSAANKAGDAQQPGSSSEELFKMTCTCPHLANHPGRDGLLRKLVEVRNEINTALVMKERNTVGVFGALEGEGMGRLDSQCYDCEEHSLDELDNLLTCLECGYTGCGSPPNRHILRHCLMQPGDSHCVAVHRTRAEIFCARCCDYVYDVEFDAAILRADEEFELSVVRNGGFGGDECLRGRRRRRARRDGYYVITDRFGQQPERERSWPPPILLSPVKGRLVAAGVRGMFNLGNTCFMSSVLQAVLHISVMQSFFSEKGHEPAKCEKLRKETTRLKFQILQYDSKASFDTVGGGRGGGGSKGIVGPEGGGKPNGTKKLGDYCIACELARLFEDMYSAEASAATLEDAEPYVPNRLLEAVWSASEFLAGYEQQDAHEFLIAVLDNLHGHLDRAAKNESSAPILRRTLAAHKHRAKQQQLQQQQKQQQPPQQKLMEQQPPQQQSHKDKKAADKIRGRGAGESPSPAATAVTSPPSKVEGGNRDKSKSKAKKRKQGPKFTEAEALVGWESPALFESAAAAKAKAKANAAAAAASRMGGESKNKRVVLSPLMQRTKTMDSSGERLGNTKPAEFQSNGSTVVSPVDPLTLPSLPPQGSSKVGKALPNVSPRDEAIKEGGDVRAAGGGVDRFAEKAGGAAAKSVLNGQCLEDLNLAGFVQEVFAGVTRSDVVCTACGDVSCTYERFLEVSLPVRPEELEKRQHHDHFDYQQQQQQQDKPVVSPDRSTVDGSSMSGGAGIAGSSAGKDTALHNGGGRYSGEGDFSTANGALPHAESRRVSPEPCEEVGVRMKEESRTPGARSGGASKRSLGRKGFGGKGGAVGVASAPRSISDCFARFAAREDLTARMACDSCSASSVFKTKQMSFCSLPRVLVLHLKRFDAMADRKIDDFVSFPATGLDMGKYLTGWPASSAREDRRKRCVDASCADAATSNEAAVPPPSLLYDLVAVVNHSGSMAQGHYTAFVKELGIWFEFDDTWVSEVSEDEVVASEAYILFYFQRGADAIWRPKPVASTSSDVAAPTSPSRSNGARVSSPASSAGNKRL